MPSSTTGAKKCKTASHFGASFRVYITKGKSRISCRKARKIVAEPPLERIPHYQYFDWTKGGNGPGRTCTTATTTRWSSARSMRDI